jgi:hypothetical protein
LYNESHIVALPTRELAQRIPMISCSESWTTIQIFELSCLDDYAGAPSTIDVNSSVGAAQEQPQHWLCGPA